MFFLPYVWCRKPAAVAEPASPKPPELFLVVKLTNGLRRFRGISSLKHVVNEHGDLSIVVTNPSGAVSTTISSYAAGEWQSCEIMDQAQIDMEISKQSPS